MANTIRVDVHTHVFHSKIADKVVTQLEKHYGIRHTGSGLWEDLEPRLDKAGIQKCIVHSAATIPSQVISANQWALSLLNQTKIIPFGTMHPDFPNMKAELAKLFDSGIRGIKIHPDFQNFRLDDPKILPLFGEMAGNFTLMVHVGDRFSPAKNASCPWKIAQIKRKFPRLRVIAAHFGGAFHWKYVVDAMKGLDIFMDTSSSLFAIPQPILEQIFNAFPRYLFLFGSDYPLFDPADQMEKLQRRLRLSSSQLEEIMTAGSRLDLF